MGFNKVVYIKHYTFKQMGKVVLFQVLVKHFTDLVYTQSIHSSKLQPDLIVADLFEFYDT